MRARLGLLVVGLASLGGCKDAGVEKYTPPESKARQALEAALSRWRDGQARPEPFVIDAVSVQILDTAWASGQKLHGFEILSEEHDGTGPRFYSVKMKTPKGDQTVK